MKDMKELLHSAHLTKTQRIIAEYVLDNASEACFMTSTEIALKLGVSESSVIRFSRTIGFDGFMDFQKALRKDYQDKVLSISSSITIPSQRIAKQAKLDNSSDYINRHFKNAAHNLEEIFIQNSIETFEKAADLIVSSTQIHCCNERKYLSCRFLSPVFKADGSACNHDNHNVHEPD